MVTVFLLEESVDHLRPRLGQLPFNDASFCVLKVRHRFLSWQGRNLCGATSLRNHSRATSLRSNSRDTCSRDMIKRRNTAASRAFRRGIEGRVNGSEWRCKRLPRSRRGKRGKIAKRRRNTGGLGTRAGGPIPTIKRLRPPTPSHNRWRLGLGAGRRARRTGGREGGGQGTKQNIAQCRLC